VINDNKERMHSRPEAWAVLGSEAVNRYGGTQKGANDAWECWGSSWEALREMGCGMFAVEKEAKDDKRTDSKRVSGRI
jgi:hypothetical protein